MTTVPAAAQTAPADRRRWILIATIIGSSMTFVDGTVVNIALPTIGRDLDAGLSAQQWVMLSYSLAVASLYIVSGALGDRYGRWTLFVCGVAGFACASALAGLAPNTGLLVAGRVLQGVAGRASDHEQPRAPARDLRRGQRPGGRPVDGVERDRHDDRTAARRPPGRVRVVAVDLLPQPARGCDRARRWRSRAAVASSRPRRCGRCSGRPPPRSRVTFGALTFGLIDGGQAGFASAWWAFALAAAGLALLIVLERRSSSPLLPSRAAARARVRRRQHLHAARVRRSRRHDVLPRPVPAVRRRRLHARAGVARLPADQPSSCSCWRPGSAAWPTATGRAAT